jgi:uncharacterized protein
MQALKDHCEQEARAGRLAYQTCRRCGNAQVFPRPFCSRCGSADLAWNAAAGTGTVVGHSVLHRAPTPADRERLPYAVALVELDEGLRVMGNAGLDLGIGARVSLSFAAHGTRCLLRFDPLEQEPQ